MPAFKRDSAGRLRDAERCMKGGEPLTMCEASFISSLMGHAQHIDAATVRFTMHIDGSLDGQINLKSEYTRELERAERERAGTCAAAAPAAAPAAANNLAKETRTVKCAFLSPVPHQCPVDTRVQFR